MVCLAPQLFFLVYLYVNVELPALSVTALPSPPAATLPALVLQLPPFYESFVPGCLSPPLLQVWMNISSLTPWLSDLHIVQFSGSSGCFLCLNLLFSFFWLCEEAQCIYLCLLLGQKLEQFLMVFFFTNTLEYLQSWATNLHAPLQQVPQWQGLSSCLHCLL